MCTHASLLIVLADTQALYMWGIITADPSLLLVLLFSIHRS